MDMEQRTEEIIEADLMDSGQDNFDHGSRRRSGTAQMPIEEAVLWIVGTVILIVAVIWLF